MAERGNSLLRGLDEKLGPLLLRALATIRSKKQRPVNIERIGIICVGALGDLLLLSAIFPILQKAYPNAKIVVLVSNSNKVILPILPKYNFEILPLTSPFKASKLLKRLNFDIILDSTQWARLPAIMVATTRAYTIGFKTNGQKRHLSYDYSIEHKDNAHEIENFKALGATIAPMQAVKPRLHLSESVPIRVSEIFALLLDSKYVCFHAWPSGKNAHLKEWPNTYWEEISKHVIAKGYKIILTGGPDDIKKSAALYQVINQPDSVLDMAGKLCLNETAHVLKAASCTISVNTGVMHIAATFDNPLIGLSGPTNINRWGALSDYAYNPAPLVEGCGYLNLGFEYPDNPPKCMESLPVSSVIAAFDEAVS